MEGRQGGLPVLRHRRDRRRVRAGHRMAGARRAASPRSAQPRSHGFRAGTGRHRGGGVLAAVRLGRTDRAAELAGDPGQPGGAGPLRKTRQQGCVAATARLGAVDRRLDGYANRVAQIQSGTEPAANLEQVGDYTRRAADAGASLVLFPEATMCRFGVPLAPVAEPVDGPWADGVRRIAAGAGVTVVAGMFVPADDGRVTNTLIASGPGVDAHYDKIDLYDAFGFTESRTVAPGHQPVTITVDGVERRAHPLLRRPLPRALRRAGAAWGATHHRARLMGLRTGQARAVDAAGPRPGAGHREFRRRGRPGLSGRRDRRGGTDGSGRQRGFVPVGRSPGGGGARPGSCSSPISTPMRWSRSGTRSRCCVIAPTSPELIGQNRGGD